MHSSELKHWINPFSPHLTLSNYFTLPPISLPTSTYVVIFFVQSCLVCLSAGYINNSPSDLHLPDRAKEAAATSGAVKLVRSPSPASAALWMIITSAETSTSFCLLLHQSNTWQPVYELQRGPPSVCIGCTFAAHWPCVRELSVLSD